MDWPANHFFYVIAPRSHYLSKSGAVKVGITSNPGSRILQLQTGHPEKLEMVHWFGFPNRWQASSIERSVFEVAAEHRLSGEWFNIPWPRALMIGAVNAIARFSEIDGLTYDDMVAAEPTARIFEGLEKAGYAGPDDSFAYCAFWAGRDVEGDE